MMTRLAQTILRHVAAGRYELSAHAQNRLDERGIAEWQVIAASQAGRVVAERPGNRPNPVVEIVIDLADGSPCKAVWALRPGGTALLVTVHFL